MAHGEHPPETAVSSPATSTRVGERPAPRTNALALTALVIAVAGSVLGLVVYALILPIACVIALVLGYRALKEIDLAGGRQTGRSAALVAVTLGWLGILAGVILVIVFFVLAEEAENEPPFGVAILLLGRLTV